MKLFKALVAVAAAFGAGYLIHQILTEEKKECERRCKQAFPVWT